MKTILLAMPGTMEMALLALAILLLFGGKKIPELMRGLGKGINEFKKGKNESDKKSEDNQES
jgi:sec-independent protein translocase protein TatA|tara:strand:- start:699 stop:884 length:186 start_codon:yes stop_codon:yes gene_type:complete